MGDISKGKEIAEFIKRVWCRENQEAYDYVIKWMAHLIQFPGKQMKTAICVRGNEGTGKSSIIQMLCKILGFTHALQEAEIENIFGSFNTLIQGKMLIYLNEAIFAGDKRTTNKFLNAITEPTVSINTKGITQYPMKNLANYIVDTNADRIIDASKTSRRFVVLDTTDEVLSWPTEEVERVLFADPIHIAKYLYEIDLTGWQPKNIPITESL
jgi:hypothetical protein